MQLIKRITEKLFCRKYQKIVFHNNIQICAGIPQTIDQWKCKGILNVNFENSPQLKYFSQHAFQPAIFHFLNVLTPSFFHSSALIQICLNCSMLASEQAPM